MADTFPAQGHMQWLGKVHHHIHVGLLAQLERDGLLQHSHHPRVHVHHIILSTHDTSLVHVWKAEPST